MPLKIIQEQMNDLSVIHKALMRSRIQQIPAEDQDGIISVLVQDVFGGEILKTKNKNGWHFYNRVNGVQLDFSKSDFGEYSDAGQFEDIPVSHDEINSQFEVEQYSVFLMKFVSSFEEIVGLKNTYHAEYSN